MIGEMEIPVEVIVKYNEAGQIIPLKIIFQDNIFVIDKIGGYKNVTPRGSFAVAIEYVCYIGGRKRHLYFDRYNSRWFVIKTVKAERCRYNPLNYDVQY